MIRTFGIILTLIGVAFLFFSLFLEYETPLELSGSASYYAASTAEDTGSANLVSAIVVTYRGLDTLGEVTILFLTSSIMSYMLKTKKARNQRTFRESSELLRTASALLVPFIILLGVFIFVHGHLSPGGGFQGGAVLASALVLLLVADPLYTVQSRILSVIESSSGFLYVLLGLSGLLFGAGFLDSRVLPTGRVGELFSAGLIPLIYILIGLKVGTELSNLLSVFHSVQGQDLMEDEGGAR
ncbi:MAG: hypothetical protein JXK93_10480 [Sphaerochaetaceae bacterium]|nr:hypothetical protein [Sphaerochaetaceae bacterium]